MIHGVKKRELLNNQDILDRVTQKLLKMRSDRKAANIISYEVINGYKLDSRNIFELARSAKGKGMEKNWEAD